MEETTRTKVYEAIELYNRGEYLQCQEPLKAAHQEVEGNEQALLRALIALACGMYLHFGPGARRGVENLLRRSLIELDEFRPTYIGVDVEKLWADINSYVEELHGRRKAGARFLDRWLAPRIRWNRES